MNIYDIPKSVLDLISTLSRGDLTWPEPEVLQRSLPPVLALTRNLLPPLLADLVFDAGRRLNCPPDFVAPPLIVSLGAVIGARCGVRPKRYDDWLEVPNLWGAVVGRPGMLKSPAIKQATVAVGALEKHARDRYESELREHVEKEFNRKFELEAAKRELNEIPKAKGTKVSDASMQELRRRCVQLSQEAVPPKLQRFKTNDATIEKLGELLTDNPTGLLVERDELVGLLASLDRDGHEGDRAFYLEAWNGQSPFTVDRIGRGSIFIKHLCLSLFGGIQPDKLSRYLYGSQHSYGNDGFLQRFQLLVYPDETSPGKLIDRAPKAGTREAVIAITQELVNTDYVSLGVERVPGGRDYFRFSDDAQQLFYEWFQGLEQRIQAEDDPIVQEHLAKFRSLVPKLALVFHLVNVLTGSAPGPISKASLEMAIGWDTYLESHARRAYALGTHGAFDAANNLADKIQKRQLADGFSERDVHRKQWALLNEIEEVRAACRELVAAGWIVRRQSTSGPGRSPSPSYDINPKVYRQVKKSKRRKKTTP